MKIGLAVILSCRLILQYIKAATRRAHADVLGRAARLSRVDLDAMNALYKVRINDFIELKSQLKDQMTLDNRHQVSQI